MNHSLLESVQTIDADAQGRSRDAVREKQVFKNKLKYMPRQQQIIRLCRNIAALEEGQETFLALVNEDSVRMNDGKDSSVLQVWRQDFSIAGEFMTEKDLRELAEIELGD